MPINFPIPLCISLNIISAVFVALSFLQTPWNLILFLGLDIPFFLFLVFLFKKNNDNEAAAAAAVPEPLWYSGWIRDVGDFVILAAGLFLQQHIDPCGCGWHCFGFIVATSMLIGTFVMIINPRISLVLVDLLISLISVFWVFWAKSIKSTDSDTTWSEYLGLIVTSLLCFFLLCYRNYYEERMGGNPEPFTVVGLLVNRVYPAIVTRVANFWAHLGACLVAISNCLFGTNSGGDQEENQPLVESHQPDPGQTMALSTGPGADATQEDDYTSS